MEERTLRPRTLILGTGILAALSLLGMLLIQTLVPTTRLPQALPTVGPLERERIAELSFEAPTNWHAPVEMGTQQFILSPDGSTSVQPDAGPFLLFIVDPLERFRQEYNVRIDFTDPIQQLNALEVAINRDAARFKEAQPYPDAPHPAAIIRGYERGNELTIILMRTDGGRWLYIGAQARDDQFEYYDDAVFRPAIRSIALN